MHCRTNKYTIKKESTHKPTCEELEAGLKKAERRVRKAEASLEKSKEEKDDLMRKIKELKRLKPPKNSKKKACLTAEQTDIILKGLRDILTHPTQYLQD